MNNNRSNLNIPEPQRGPALLTTQAIADRIKFFVFKGAEPFRDNPNNELEMFKEFLQSTLNILMMRFETGYLTEIDSGSLSSLEGLFTEIFDVLKSRPIIPGQDFVPLFIRCRSLIKQIKTLNSLNALVAFVVSQPIDGRESYAMFEQLLKRLEYLSQNNRIAKLVELRPDIIRLIYIYRKKTFIGDKSQEETLSRIIRYFENFIGGVMYHKFYFTAIHLMSNKAIYPDYTLQLLTESLQQITRDKAHINGLNYEFLTNLRNWVDKFLIQNSNNEVRALIMRLGIPELINKCYTEYTPIQRPVDSSTPPLDVTALENKLAQQDDWNIF
jgi:hypothetical protein